MNPSNYYTENYPDYDLQNSREKIEFYVALLARHVPQGGMIFELGVGQGNFLEAASKYFKVSGCDVNKFGVGITRGKLPGASIIEGSVESVPEAGINAVVSFDVLEHLPDLGASLKEIYRKLPSGGFLIGAVPVYDGPLGFLVHRLDKDPTHVTKTSRHEWLHQLSTAGFRLVESGGILRKLVGKRYLHFTKPQFLLRSSGVALYFVAQKP